MSTQQGQLTFGATLEALIDRLQGGVAAAVVGMDGMVIEQRTSGRTPNLEFLCAEQTSLLKGARAARRDSDSGEPHELILLTDRYQFVSRLLARDYFLLLVLTPDASLGKARYEARRVGELLERELR